MIVPQTTAGVNGSPRSKSVTLDEGLAEAGRFLTAFTAGLAEDGEPVVVELRALKVPRKYGRPGTRAGFFDLPARRKEFLGAVRVLLAGRDAQPEGVYVTLNPLDPD